MYFKDDLRVTLIAAAESRRGSISSDIYHCPIDQLTKRNSSLHIIERQFKILSADKDGLSRAHRPLWQASVHGNRIRPNDEV